MTKHDKVLRHLQGGKSISGLQALSKYGLYRLSSVINVLRKRGYNIKTEMVAKKDFKFAKYSLK